MSLSRIETILSGGEVVPQSRIEKILMGEDVVPQSRIEALLKEKMGGGGGGTEITDGIVIKAKDESGYPTEIDFYNSDNKILPYQFSTYDGRGFQLSRINKINFKSPVYSIESHAFQFSSVPELNFPNVITLSEFALDSRGAVSIECGAEDFSSRGIFYQALALKNVKLPNAKRFTNDGGYVDFGSCNALETVELGSIGHGVERVNNPFKGCAQTGLTIIAYCADTYKDTLLAKIRNGATNATIIIKDSTTGETLVTSTP